MLGAHPDGMRRRRGCHIGKHAPRQEIDPRLAQPGGDMDIGRVVVDLPGRIDLHQMALLDDADARRHGHGLDLVMGHIEDGGAHVLLDALQLEAKLGAQLGVEGGQRLVHQEDGRPAHQGPADGHPLHLAAGKPRRLVAAASGRYGGARRSPPPCA